MAIEVLNRKKPYRAVLRLYGKKHSKSFRRKIDAEAWERQMLAQRDAGTLTVFLSKPVELMTVDQLRERFVRDYAEGRQSPSTRLLDAGTYKMHIQPVLGMSNARSLKRRDIQAFLLHLSQVGKLSNGQVNRIRTLLHCMFNQAVLWEIVAVNPVAGTAMLPQKRYYVEEALTYLTQEEAKMLLDWLQANDPWLYPKVRTLVNTGLRYGEMKALRVQDLVDGLRGGRLMVSRTYCRHSFQIRNQTKGKRSRAIPLGMEMTRFLRKLTEGKCVDDPLLWDSWDEGRHPTKFMKHFRQALAAAKVRRVRIHDLRHTFAVHFLECGGQLYALKNLLGHHSIRLTERYLHFSVAMAEVSRGLVDHHGGVRATMSHKSPTNAEMAADNATDSIAST